jgi:hypothetical protein
MLHGEKVSGVKCGASPQFYCEYQSYILDDSLLEIALQVAAKSGSCTGPDYLPEVRIL